MKRIFKTYVQFFPVLSIDCLRKMKIYNAFIIINVSKIPFTFFIKWKVIHFYSPIEKEKEKERKDFTNIV